eukprot:1265764-Prymnesium_polylepis.1
MVGGELDASALQGRDCGHGILRRREFGRGRSEVQGTDEWNPLPPVCQTKNRPRRSLGSHDFEPKSTTVTLTPFPHPLAVA